MARWIETWWGAVAQLGERLVRNEEVSGSIPLSSTNFAGACVAVLVLRTASRNGSLPAEPGADLGRGLSAYFAERVFVESTATAVEYRQVVKYLIL